MAEAKKSRASKKQLGQFMTPLSLAREVAKAHEYSTSIKILEPSFGDGNFIVALVEELLEELDKHADFIGYTAQQKIEHIFTKQIWGVELDKALYSKAIEKIEEKFGKLPKEHNLANDDFFATELKENFFDLAIGNPPFGGSFNVDFEAQLDAKYGSYNGLKIKKETYSFFICRSLDLLNATGKLNFICGDSFTTVSTMAGLRRRLTNEGSVSIEKVKRFSQETTYPMVVLSVDKARKSSNIMLHGEALPLSVIEKTQNYSWGMSKEFIKYFDGTLLGDFIICTGGLTSGKNEFFIREINAEGVIEERYDFTFFDDEITVNKELAKAKYNTLSSAVMKRVKEQEASKATVRNIKITPRKDAITVNLPHEHYKFYNKANSNIIFKNPTHAIYWRDNGDAVRTFKKNGNWYIRGMGGEKFYGKEGFTWNLVASRIKARYLPNGYVLDSGAPCGFLRDNVAEDELWFILAWLQTELATKILKSVINHTRNIQGKDIERLPYPHWVSTEDKLLIVKHFKEILALAKDGRIFSKNDEEIIKLNELFVFSGE